MSTTRPATTTHKGRKQVRRKRERERERKVVGFLNHVWFICLTQLGTIGIRDRSASLFSREKGVHISLPRMAEEGGSSSSPSSSPTSKSKGSGSPSFQLPHRKLPLVPLVFLIFYEVSGGPFGVEDSVRAGGPLLALLGFLLFPLIWSVPEALITAELGTMFPENGGYVVWISAAFGPFMGFQQGWWKWLSGVIDNALYPVLFLDYLKAEFPVFADGPPRVIAVLAITATLTYFNYRGLTIVGWAAVGLGIFSLLPFCLMFAIGIPHFNPSNWALVDFAQVDWSTYLNTLFWNLNYWDSVSTLVGEVENPQRTLPKALFSAVLLVVISYLVPLIGGIGAIKVVRDDWTDGYFSEIATMLGGVWLGWWVTAGAALSNMGMFEAEMSSDSFQLLGMAEMGLLPQLFAVRSRYDTPTVGILASASGVLLLSSLSFQEIIAAENYLYCFGMFMEFAAFIWLRVKRSDLPRPYRVPLSTIGVILILIPPTSLLFVVMVFATWKVVAICVGALIVGFLIYPFLMTAKRKFWFDFTWTSEIPSRMAKTETSDMVLSKDQQVGLLTEI